MSDETRDVPRLGVLEEDDEFEEFEAEDWAAPGGDASQGGQAAVGLQAQEWQADWDDDADANDDFASRLRTEMAALASAQ